MTEKMRTFTSGATRNIPGSKMDYEGFLSPAVLQRYAEYMHKHRKQADGKIRASDNWQRGIPVSSYMKSLVRHVFDLWATHRGLIRTDEHGTVYTRDELCCAIMFNVMGYLFELITDKQTDEN